MHSGVGSSFPFRIVVVASCATAIANLPVFLLGAMAPAIRTELGFSAAGTGLAVSAFFAASALSAPLMGRVVQRMEPSFALRAGALLTAAAMATIAASARSWGVLVFLLVLAGLANAVGQTASNLTLAELAAPNHDGLAFGLKQGAVPFATMLAGLAVPLFDSDGWRWSFVLGACLAGAIAVVAPRLTGLSREVLGRKGKAERSTGGRVDWTVVSLVAGGAFIAAGTALGLAVYLVEFATHQGWTADEAGTLLALVSLLTVAVRVLAGWWMDVRSSRGQDSIALLFSAIMVAGGAVGCVLLAVAGSTWSLFVLGTLLGLGLGWGWAGLMHLTIVQLNRDVAATATGVILFGVFGGGVVLPSTLGFLIEHTSYQTAWLASACGLLAAAAALLSAHAVIRARRTHS
jgi:MFS family permease